MIGSMKRLDCRGREEEKRREGELEGGEGGGVGVESMPRIDYRITITITF
jgi:hypothetical protein